MSEYRREAKVARSNDIGGTAVWGVAVLVVVTLLSVEGCGRSSPGPSVRSSVPPIRVGVGTSLSRPPTPEQVAERLIEAARVPPGAVDATTAPTRSLQSPPSAPAVTGLIVQSRWWRINRPQRAAYAWLAHHQIPGLTQEASGSSSGPALSDQEMNDDFASRQIPLSVNSAILSIAVAPLSAHTSAIGAYALVVRQPLRRASENVPFSVNSVSVVARRNVSSSGRPISASNTVTGAGARTFVHDFDQLSVNPPGARSCPLSMQTESATFRSAGHTWVATTGICVGVNVSLDGQDLPTLNTSAPFNRDMREALGHRLDKNRAQLPSR
jgi:hypothetical protein